MRRILIVDDYRDYADAAAALLRLLGHQVALAYDATAALELAAEFHPDFVFVDLVMPGMDGLALAAELRKLDCMRGAKLVALSGFTRKEHRDPALLAAFDAHLAKPASAEELSAILGEPLVFPLPASEAYAPATG